MANGDLPGSTTTDTGWKGIEHVQAAVDTIPYIGPVLRHLIDVMPSVQAHKAQEMLDALIDCCATTPSLLVERMRSEPRVQRLVWEAARAAADTEVTAKIRGLAAAAAPAVRDDAAIDESQLRIRTLAELQPLHVRALVELEASAPIAEQEAVELDELLVISKGLAAALAADLIRLALVQTRGMSFTGLHTSVKLSDYGQEIFQYLRTEEA